MGARRSRRWDSHASRRRPARRSCGELADGLLWEDERATAAIPPGGAGDGIAMHPVAAPPAAPAGSSRTDYCGKTNGLRMSGLAESF